MVKMWDYALIGDVFEFKNGLNKGKEFFGYGIPIVNYTDVYKKRALTQADIKGRVCLESDEIKRFEVKQNDVFFTRTSETPDEVGISSVLLEDIEGCVFSGFVLRARPKNNMLNPQYCKYCFSTPEVRSAIIQGCTYTTRALTNGKQLSAISIPIPPTGEQERIAEALSDVDGMISSLEKLIAKKKAVKQGAMQELLTGKKRLPGFTGNIEHKPLSSLCTLFADGDWIESKDQSNDGIRLIQTGNIGVGKYLDKTDKQRFISTETFDLLKCLEIFENDVIVSRLPEPAGRACILPYSNKRRITAVDCTIIRFADYNPILFVAYSQTKQYQDKVDMAMAGSTRQRISRKELGEIPIPVFPTIEEQNALASIFSDMDSEIEALEQKLDKTRQIKQGMMQQLLTGKIRLV